MSLLFTCQQRGIWGPVLAVALLGELWNISVTGDRTVENEACTELLWIVEDTLMRT
jgi:hypothetical protein